MARSEHVVVAWAHPLAAPEREGVAGTEDYFACEPVFARDHLLPAPPTPTVPVLDPTRHAAQRILLGSRTRGNFRVLALVLDCVPRELGRVITREVGIPTIGIGAGPDCDGQVLVLHDILGIDTGVSPRFVKSYAEVGQALSAAVQEYVAEVRRASFPAEEHCFHAPSLGLG
jgi:hypothetical protein